MAFTPGGAAFRLISYESHRVATPSDTTIILFGPVVFVHAVATCPCNRRESIRASTYLIFPSPTTVPSGNAPFGCASAVAAAFSLLWF